MSDQGPRVVAIVPAWNARGRLAQVLDALRGQVAGVVVVDNGSEDGTAAWLSGASASTWPLLSLIPCTGNRGYAAAVNLGVRRAWSDGAEAVLLVNDDALFMPGAVAQLGAALRGGLAKGAISGIGATTAHLVYAERPAILNGAGGVVDLGRAWAALRGAGEPDDGRYVDATEVDYPSGAACLIARAAWEATGPLDETWYLYFEDADWGLRARAAGWRTVYVPSARVLHIGSAGTAADPARRRYYNVRNRLRFARRHCPWGGRLWAWCATLWLLAKQPARWLDPRRRRDAEAVARAVADHLRGHYGRGDWCG